MGAFEFENNCNISARNCGCCTGDNNNERGETCIIAQKVFDQCRIQKCCSPDVLGPARMACGHMGGCNDMMCDGDIIIPPVNAATVTLHDPQLSRIDILRKCPSSFQEGCWDLELRYVFDYALEFRRSDGCPIGCVDATNSYTMKVTLFGSTESDVTSATDLYDCCGNSNGGPYVVAEGKVIGLSAELKYPGCCNNSCGCGCNCGCNCGCGCGCDNSGDASMGAPIAVNVTLGLFSIVKLFRTVNMVVQSLGRCVPEQCFTPDQNNVDPCKYFDAFPFPLDLFSPSAKPKTCCAFGDTFGKSSCFDTDTCGCDNDNSSRNNSCNDTCNNTCSNSCNNSCNNTRRNNNCCRR